MKRLIFSLLLLVPSLAWANPPCGSFLPAGTTLLTSNQTCPGTAYHASAGTFLDCGGFTITGPNTPPASCNPVVPGCITGTYGVQVDGVNGVSVKRCTITHFERGLYATNTSDSVFKANTFVDNTRYGAMLTGSGSNTRLANNSYITNRDEGVHISDLTGTGNSSTTDSAIGNIAEGFYLLAANNFTLMNCVTADNGAPGIYHKNSSNALVTNCQMTNDNIQILNSSGLPWIVNTILTAP